ncbi:MAG: calcium/sodium antiporter, partial [Gammaproteobacteria bacterium]|nr:calcium/sodium antiporter [Gammaproteobacteria bacterium]
VGIVTSMPEILVGSVAAMEGKTEIAIGNAIGSNIANIGLVLGMTVCITPFFILSRTLRREFLVMFLSSLLALLLMLDNNLDRLDAIVLLVALVIVLAWIVRIARSSPKSDPLTGEIEKELAHVSSAPIAVANLLLGLLALLGGAELLVRCAVVIARHLGISDLVIGLTIIAIGTSLPELAASIMSVIKKEADIAVGNILGSNMFNMLAVISVPVLIHPTAFSLDVVIRDFPVMIALTLLMGWMVFIHGSGRFSRSEGVVLLLCFIAYQFWLFTDRADVIV